MNESMSSPEDNELTEEDLAVLRAFDTRESWDERADHPANKNDDQKMDDLNYEAEMLLIFLEETTEDIEKIHQALTQLEKERQLDASHFSPFRRLGHKLRGTSAAMGYGTMSTVAQYLEDIAEQAQNKMISPPTAYQAIMQTASILNFCQQYLEQNAHEPEDPALISTLQEFYQALNIDLLSPIVKPDKATEAATAGSPEDVMLATSEQKSTMSPLELETTTSDTEIIRVKKQHIEHLQQHTAQLIEQHAVLEVAQKKVENAIQDLQKAQDRLLHLEQALSTLARIETSEQTSHEATISSSLIARILNKAPRETLHLLKNSKERLQNISKAQSGWDELDIEQYSEQDLLFQDLRETIVEISVCTARVNAAYATLHKLQQDYIAGVTQIRQDTQRLHLAPLSTILPDLQQTIAESALAKHHHVNFEFKGEQIGIDQKILAYLRAPLQQLLSTCIPGIEDVAKGKKRTYQIWFHARINNNIITIEIGFSMPVQGGAIEAISEALQHIDGTITFQRNTKGAVSFLLHLPHSQDSVSCLTVRVDNQLLAIPVTQIAHIGIQSEATFDICYSLHELLELPHVSTSEAKLTGPQPILLISRAVNSAVYAIQVDEIVAETELIIKPLQEYLKRPGISEYALDGEGNVLLLLNISDVLGYYINIRSRISISSQQGQNGSSSPPEPIKKSTPRILIAEDSAYQRQAIIHTLRHAHYQMELAEARDGMDALEQLLSQPPDILLLDIEMPNLSGFDVLNLIRTNAEITTVKTIMLTSRNSDKHRERARELGAHAYLTKPCHEETLLNTIQKLLA